MAPTQKDLSKRYTQQPKFVGGFHPTLQALKRQTMLLDEI